LTPQEKEQVKIQLTAIGKPKLDDVFSFIYSHNIKNEKGGGINLASHYPLKEIYLDESPVIVIKKSAQIGITLMNLLKMFYRCVKEGAITFIYTLPTSGDVSKFSQARFNPLIQKSLIQNLYPVEIDNVELKKIRDSFIYFRGTFAEREAINVPADVLIIDEVDFSKPDIIEMYSKRLGASLYKWKWLYSTPTYPDYGIDKEFVKGTQKIWLVRCPHCNYEQELNFFTNIEGERPQARFICGKCKRGLSNQDRLDGRWVAKYPGRDTQSYHVTSLVFPFITANDLKKAEQDAKFKKTFFNFDLGETYSEGEDKISRDLVLKCVRNRPMRGAGEGFFMGVDQGNVLHYVVLSVDGPISNMESAGITDSFDRIGELMNVYGVRLCVVDAGPNEHSARELRDNFEGRIYLNYYRDVEGGMKRGKVDYSIITDRTEGLDMVASDLAQGLITLPEMGELKEEFIAHLTNMRREIIEDKHGQRRAVWVKTGADHFLHALNYAQIAKKIDAEGGYQVEGEETETVIMDTYEPIEESYL